MAIGTGKEMGRKTEWRRTDKRIHNGDTEKHDNMEGEWDCIRKVPEHIEKDSVYISNIICDEGYEGDKGQAG